MFWLLTYGLAHSTPFRVLPGSLWTLPWDFLWIQPSKKDCCKAPVHTAAENGSMGPRLTAFLYSACFSIPPTPVFPPLVCQKDKLKFLRQMNVALYYFSQEPGLLDIREQVEAKDSGFIFWVSMNQGDQGTRNPWQRKMETPHVPPLEPSGKLCQRQPRGRKEGFKCSWVLLSPDMVTCIIETISLGVGPWTVASSLSRSIQQTSHPLPWSRPSIICP